MLLQSISDLASKLLPIFLGLDSLNAGVDQRLNEVINSQDDSTNNTIFLEASIRSAL
ncbi:hypothetical protein D3C84_692630 [compost metagenome]